MSVAEPAERSPYRGYRFPPEIIAHAVWLYFRFHLSFRDVQDLLAERGIIVSHETIRAWCSKFGPSYAAGLRRRRARAGDKWHLDEVALKIRGKRHWLWRAVDQHGVVLDILVQERRDQTAAGAFCCGCFRASWVLTARRDHGQARKLPASHSTGAAEHRASATQASEQSGGEFAPADPQTRAGAPAFQIR
jgi:transposase-like protein